MLKPAKLQNTLKNSGAKNILTVLITIILIVIIPIGKPLKYQFG